MILNTTQIISEVMTSVPQAPAGTINPTQVDPEEERRRKHIEKLQTLNAVGSFVRPAVSSFSYGAGAALASKLASKTLGLGLKGASFLMDKAKGITQ